MEEHESARAVGVLGLSRLEATLPEERGLLVARSTANGDSRRNVRIVGHAEGTRARANLGHYLRGNVEQVEQFLVPAKLVDVEQHRAARVGDVGGMYLAARKVPDEPAVDGSEEQATLISKGACVFRVVEQPLDLACRKVRVRPQTGRADDLLDDFRTRTELLDNGRGAPALPDDGVCNGTTRLAIPQHGRLALVGDADAIYVACREGVRGEQVGERTQLREDDLLGVLLDPSRLRIYLGELALNGIDEPSVMVDEDGARRCRPLVKGDDIPAAHRAPPLKCPSSQVSTSS